MSKQIWKYSLNEVGTNTFEIPHDATILSCQLQNNVPTIWAKVDPTEVKSERYFEVVGTGHEVSEDIDSGTYINTIQLPNGIVLHIFEIYK